MKFFSGVPFLVLDPLPLIPLGEWLLPVGVCFLAAGACMEKNRRLEVLCCYRFGTMQRWWSRKFRNGLITGGLAACFLLLLSTLTGLAGGSTGGLAAEEIWRVSVLWLTHMAANLSLFLLLDLLRIRRTAPAALLLLEGGTFLIGCKMPEAAVLMYGTWGMYLRSGWFDREQGFSVPVVLVVEAVVTAACYYAGKTILEERKIE